MPRPALFGLRTLSLLILGVILFAGSAMMIGHDAREQLLHQRAVSEARTWGEHLLANVEDLADVIAGQEPSAESLRLLEQTRRAGDVFRYKVFDRQGIVRHVSEGGKWDDLHARSKGEFSAVALQVVESLVPVIEARRGNGISRPFFFTSAYLPLKQHADVLGVIEIYIDHSASAARFDSILLKTGISITLITGLAFLLPMIGFFWEARQRARTADQLLHIANHDDLTELLNRNAFLEAVDSMVANSAMFAVHIIDLDRFKDINDTHGHPVGDALLRDVANRLRDTAGRSARIARLGGDEFALLQPIQSAESREVSRLAHRVVRALSVPYSIDGLELSIGASVGTALFPQDGLFGLSIIKAADLALYAAKRLGRGQAVAFEPTIEEERRARHALEGRVRQAVDTGDFDLNFQPLFATDGKTLRAFEALLRLKDQDGGNIPPAVFIPVAEEMRVIDRIGEWVLREACRTATLWPDTITVAVNLSPLQFGSGALGDLVERTLKETGLAPGRLELEVTEGILLENSEWVLQQLHALKALGVSIALDDFGTGYSSLSYLWRFPFDTLKVDGSFMKGISDPTSRSREVLDTIIALGKVLDLQVTAEGVETEEQITVLRELKCDFVQGFLFGRPVPALDVAATILKASRAVTEAGTQPASRVA